MHGCNKIDMSAMDELRIDIKRIIDEISMFDALLFRLCIDASDLNYFDVLITRYVRQRDELQSLANYLQIMLDEMYEDEVE